MGDDETAHPARRPVLFVNPTSGGGGAVHAGVPERARERGIDVIVLRPDHSLATLVRQAVAGGADALGVAGGDGSLAVVATAAQANGLPFVCIPAGTRNHFALDLGVDRHDPIGALDAFTDWRRAPHRRRPGQRAPVPQQRLARALRRSGPSTRLPRTPSCARCWRPQRRRSVPAGRRQSCTSSTTSGGSTTTPRSCWSPTIPTPWTRHGRPAPARPSTAAGSGSSSSTHRATPRVPTGRAWSATSFEVTAPGAVHAGVDGEAVDLRPPLEFVIQPGGAAGPNPRQPRRSPRRPGHPSPSERSGRRGTMPGEKREVMTTLACLPSASPEGRERRTA